MVAKEKKNKTNPILKIWNGYEFRLHVPKVINKDNKIEVHFNYVNPATGHAKQIKRSSGIDRYSTKKIYTEQAQELVEALIRNLEAGYNFITGETSDYSKLSTASTVTQCIDAWLKVRQSDFEIGRIQKGEMNLTNNVLSLYRAYLLKNNLSFEKPSIFTVNDINQFMRYIEKDSNRLRTYEEGDKKKDKVTPLGKHTYNSYLARLSYFFEFLRIERLIVYNPVEGAHKYQTANLETRFKIYEDDELELVRKLLSENDDYIDLLLASHFLYGYRIRGKEQLRIKVKYINFETGTLIIPQEVEEHGRTIKGTKNGNGAEFQLNKKILDLIKLYLGDSINEPEYFIFGGQNKPGKTQRYESFFSNRFAKFRTEKELPKHLKFYSLKHTSNYSDYQELGIEALSLLNRHSTIGTTQVYINSKLKKHVIRISEDGGF